MHCTLICTAMIVSNGYRVISLYGFNAIMNLLFDTYLVTYLLLKLLRSINKLMSSIVPFISDVSVLLACSENSGFAAVNVDIHHFIVKCIQLISPNRRL